VSRLSQLTLDADTNAWMNEGERLVRAIAKRILFLDVMRDIDQDEIERQQRWYRITPENCSASHTTDRPRARWRTMTDIPIPLGPWEPDKAAHMSTSLTEAINVLPVAGAYAPFRGLFPTPGQILPSAARGYFAIPMPDGSPLIYAATATDIYKIAGSSPTVVYAGGAITPAYWRFVQFQGRTIAINPEVNPAGRYYGLFHCTWRHTATRQSCCRGRRFPCARQSAERRRRRVPAQPDSLVGV
jgi:hypothetical protein